MITVQREQIADIRAEVEPLLVEHWREIAHYQDIELDPDWDFYCTAKTLRCFTARADGVLVGYACFFISRNRHYMGSVQAVQDVLFVHPDHRGMAGVRLLRFCDQQLKAEGAQAVYHHVKKEHPALGALLRLRGYEEVDIIYAKRLDKEKAWLQPSP